MLPPFTSSRISTWAECPPELENATMDEILRHNAEAYANRHQLRLAEQPGFGIHGIIIVRAKESIMARKDPPP